MQVTLCDCCGKIIKDERQEYYLTMGTVQAERDFMGKRTDDVDFSTKLPNVCKDCANSIYHYIKGLSKEDNT